MNDEELVQAMLAEWRKPVIVVNELVTAKIADALEPYQERHAVRWAMALRVHDAVVQISDEKYVNEEDRMRSLLTLVMREISTQTARDTGYVNGLKNAIKMIEELTCSCPYAPCPHDEAKGVALEKLRFAIRPESS